MTRTKRLSPRRRRIATVLLPAATVAVAGCGSSNKIVSSTGSNGQVTTQTVPSVRFAKTKFLLHTGLAFGAIHRYIYKPLRVGALRGGAPGRIKVLLKGAAAAVFAVHELKLAHDDALSSDLLRPLANEIDGLGHKLSGLVSSLKSGSVNPETFVNSSAAADALGSASSGLGCESKTSPEPSASAAGGRSSLEECPLAFETAPPISIPSSDVWGVCLSSS